MRLVNYGAGEITDRLTILALKILFGKERSREVKHFIDERNALLVKLGSRALSGTWLETAIELAAVNGALWHAEDDLREIRAHDPNDGLMEEAGRIGCRIQDLNDHRMRLVQRINIDVGEHRGEEKAHEPSPASKPPTPRPADDRTNLRAVSD
jgi:hypothetical protein